MNEISTSGVTVISNPTVCDAVFVEMKLIVALGFLNLPFSNLNLA